MNKRILCAALFCLLTAQANAGSYNDAVLAYQQGQLAESVESFFELAKQNDPDAQYALASLFEKGNEVQANMTQALHWYEQAAKRNHPFALAALGRIVMKGEHAPKDEALALSYFLRAGSQGHPVSQYNVAVMLEQGIGAQSDPQEAMLWYEKAAFAGHAQAQYQIGIKTALTGTSDENLTRAYGWLDMASKSTDTHVAEQAKKARDQVAIRMTAPALAQARNQSEKLQEMTLIVAAPAIRAMDAAPEKSAHNNLPADAQPLEPVEYVAPTDPQD